MEQETYTEDILMVSGDTVTRKQDLKKRVLPLTILLVSTVVLILSSQVYDRESTLAIVLPTLGVIGAIVGLAGMLMSKKHYIFTPTGSVICVESVYVETADLHKLSAIISEERFEALGFIKKTDSSGVKLDVWLSKDGNFAALQLLQYRPHEFYATSPIIKVPSREIPHIVTFLTKSV